MKQIGLIFPDELSTNNKVLSAINKSDALLMYEPCDTFYQLKHHKHKLALQISALRHWKKTLEKDFENIFVSIPSFDKSLIICSIIFPFLSIRMKLGGFSFTLSIILIKPSEPKFFFHLF